MSTTHRTSPSPSRTLPARLNASAASAAWTCLCASRRRLFGLGASRRSPRRAASLESMPLSRRRRRLPPRSSTPPSVDPPREKTPSGTPIPCVGGEKSWRKRRMLSCLGGSRSTADRPTSGWFCLESFFGVALQKMKSSCVICLAKNPAASTQGRLEGQG